MSSVEERLEQNRKDQKLLQEEEKRLLRKLDEERDRVEIAGANLVKDQDILDYVAHRPEVFGEAKVSFMPMQGKSCIHKTLLAIPLPNANDEWTWAAFDYAKNFCRNFPRCYPVHGVLVPDAKHLFITIL